MTYFGRRFGGVFETKLNIRVHEYTRASFQETLKVLFVYFLIFKNTTIEGSDGV